MRAGKILEAVELQTGEISVEISVDHLRRPSPSNNKG